MPFSNLQMTIPLPGSGAKRFLFSGILWQGIPDRTLILWFIIPWDTSVSALRILQRPKNFSRLPKIYLLNMYFHTLQDAGMSSKQRSNLIHKMPKPYTTLGTCSTIIRRHWLWITGAGQWKQIRTSPSHTVTWAGVPGIVAKIP